MPLLSVAHELTHVAFDLLKQIQACPREGGGGVALGVPVASSSLPDYSPRVAP
jgi:hypothetical protein